MEEKFKALCTILWRKRVFHPNQLAQGNLKRCLKYWDLVALGLGSTLGVGIYVLIGTVAMKTAGPSVVLSFLIAAVASMIAGLCYAEFGSRVPRAGSAYIYSYMTVGEVVAFFIGWNMILEGIFGTASVAKGLSTFVDTSVDHAMSRWLTSVFPLTIGGHISPYFDLFSFTCIIVLGILLAFGVRESAKVINVLSLTGLLVVTFMVITGAFKADPKNWSIPAAEVPPGYGTGGFFPYGVWGMLKGAAICFYGFVGFDSINSSSEEVKNPQRTIPKAIITVLSIVLVAYISVSIVVTMMVPYFHESQMSSVQSAFAYVDMNWAKTIISFGALFGIAASLLGAMFPIPRLLYAMASDGLLFHFLTKLSTKRKSPAIATLIPTAVIATLSALLTLELLVSMMCIGMLMSYTIVAACVIVLRYEFRQTADEQSAFEQLAAVQAAPTQSKPASKERICFLCQRFLSKRPTRVSSYIINTTVVLFIIVCIIMGAVIVTYDRLVLPLSILHGVALILLLIMLGQPFADDSELSFKTPLVPVIPLLSIYINIHLMMFLSALTWTRVAIWMAIGVPVYIFCIWWYSRKRARIHGTNNDTNNNNGTKNRKSSIEIVVESPTPTSTVKKNGQQGIYIDDDKIEVVDESKERTRAQTEVLHMQQAVIEDNEEREAKIIDLLDKVLQAEEDSYGEVISLKDQIDQVVSAEHAKPVHRKSIDELSDAGSDASLCQVQSKYDVIAQVHQEDLPKLNEDEEKSENGEVYINHDDVPEDEQVTAFNESDNNSRTDESGYSDTIDRITPDESIEELREIPFIPVPPPLDEKFFANPAFRKSYTISARPARAKLSEPVEEVKKPRDSIKSNNSQDDGNIVFGSDKQMNFMSKLNNIFQNKMTSEDDDGKRRRSNSMGDVSESVDYQEKKIERPAMFFELQKELLSKETAHILRPVTANDSTYKEDQSDEEETALSRENLKVKLESIFAGGLKKPNGRLKKSSPSTPEESPNADASNSENVDKSQKPEKNDTLKRQKAKFGDVLNSIRMMNKDELV